MPCGSYFFCRCDLLPLIIFHVNFSWKRNQVNSIAEQRSRLYLILDFIFNATNIKINKQARNKWVHFFYRSIIWFRLKSKIDFTENHLFKIAHWNAINDNIIPNIYVRHWFDSHDKFTFHVVKIASFSKHRLSAFNWFRLRLAYNWLSNFMDDQP